MMSEKKNNSALYLIGGLFGAIIGLASVYLLEKSGDLEGEENIFNSKNLSKVGLKAISFLYPLIGKGKGKGQGKRKGIL
jgi:hypothetical protein